MGTIHLRSDRKLRRRYSENIFVGMREWKKRIPIWILEHLIHIKFNNYCYLLLPMVTTIQIDNELKERLNCLKIHPRESYNDLISRLVDSYSPEVASRESLIETLEILSDPEIMRGIARGLEDIKVGRVKTLDQISKELD